MSHAILEAPTADAPPIRRDAERWAWEVATLYPQQGGWSEHDYLDLTMRTNRLVELVDGHLRVLPMPAIEHQAAVHQLCTAVNAFARPRKLGRALVAPLPVRLDERHFREPDVLFLRTGHPARGKDVAVTQPDLAMEVLSESTRTIDLVKKRQEYAAAGVAEYWLIDPESRRVTVLVLRDGVYEVDGDYGLGEVAKSRLLEGFEVDLTAFWAEVEAMG